MSTKETFNKILNIIKTIAAIVAAIFAIIGLTALKKKTKSTDKVEPEEIKEGTTVVKPEIIDNSKGRPFDDDYEITTPDGEKIETPIPDDHLNEIIRNKIEGTRSDPKHKKKSNKLLEKIKNIKKGNDNNIL